MKPWVRDYIRQHGEDPDAIEDACAKLAITDAEYERALLDRMEPRSLTTTNTKGQPA